MNPLTPELNPTAQRCLTRFFTGVLLLEPCIFLLEILIFKGLAARRLYKSFGVKGLIKVVVLRTCNITEVPPKNITSYTVGVSVCVYLGVLRVCWRVYGQVEIHH
jgi:hypothetical protein